MNFKVNDKVKVKYNGYWLQGFIKEVLPDAWVKIEINVYYTTNPSIKSIETVRHMSELMVAK